MKIGISILPALLIGTIIMIYFGYYYNYDILIFVYFCSYIFY